MASTVSEPDVAAPQEPEGRSRRRAVAVVVAAALVLGLVGALTYRQTVRAEREALFFSALQSQSMSSFDTLAKIGWGQIPFDEPGIRDRFTLELYGPYERSSVVITAGQWRLSEGGTSFVVQEATATNADLPGWVGDVSFYVSILLYGTYSDENGVVSSDEGSCLLRVGSWDAPLAEGEVQLTPTARMQACTREQLARFRMM